MFQDLTKGLMDYNGVIFTTMDSIRSQAVQPIAMTILLLMFYFEFLNTRQMFMDGGGDLELAFFAPAIMRYLFAYIGMVGSGGILQFFLKIMSEIILKIQEITGITGLDATAYVSFPKATMKGSLGEKAIEAGIWIFAFLIAIIINIVVPVLITVMYLTMYILFAISPLLICTLVSEEHRQIGVNFFKTFLGTALEGPILTLAVILVNLIGKSYQTNVDLGGALSAANPAVTMLTQRFVMLFILIGSAGIAMRLIKG